jgi:bacillithiol system protein YtxJ
MVWHQLTDLSQIHHILEISREQSGSVRTVLIFKHSTRCSISKMALSRLESNSPEGMDCDCYFLDVLHDRAVSDELARLLQIQHESPQVFVLRNGKCIYHNSHSGIQTSEIIPLISA